MKKQPGGDIWLSGGAQLATRLAGEIDRLILKRQPLLFGPGSRCSRPDAEASFRARVGFFGFGGK